MPINDYIRRLTEDEFLAYMSPSTAFLPFLADYKLADPYKSNSRNVDYVWKKVDEFMKISKDEKALYHAMFKTGKFSRQDLLMDTAVLIIAASDTVAHTLTSAIYQLEVNPDKKEHLLKELKMTVFPKLDNHDHHDMSDAIEG